MTPGGVAGHRPEPPTGRQTEIVAEGQRAAVVEWGGALRAYTVNGQAVLDGFDSADIPSGARGLPLVPWPNRIADGRYRWQGQDQQLAITQPSSNTAIHGLGRYAAWTVVDSGPGRVSVAVAIRPQPGWPFVLRVEVTYALDRTGLTVTTTATNTGSIPCPYAAGQHPYLTVGTPRVDDAVLTVPAATRLTTDERGIPTGRAAAAGTAYDLRRPTRIGDRVLDTAYTDLDRDADGLVRVRLAAPDGGRAVTWWADEAYAFVQVFTGDSLPHPQRRRGLAVEPMTAPANAFASGDHLLTLEPGATHTARWGLQPASLADRG